MRRRSFAPLWLSGLTNSAFGMYGGVVATSVPQILSARHVPEATIAAISAVVISPGFWTFLVSPVLDVRFSRRWYSVVTAAAAAVMLVLALVSLKHLLLFEILMLAGFFFANLCQSAIGGWLASITASEQQNMLSVWVTVGNIGGGGAMAVLAGELMRNLPPILAAVLLGGAIMLPTAVFPWMKAPGPDRRLASESFPQFFREILNLLKRPQVLLALLLFIAPTATFSLTNFLGGLGDDYHASNHFVGLVGGAGVLLGGIAGCFVFPLIDRFMPLRLLYLAIGAVGSVFTLMLIALPRTPAMFAVAFIGENVFQALAITASTAITFVAIGRGNPLSATTFCLMTSAFNVPISYMLLVDGAGYSKLGVAGSYAADAGLSLLASLVLGALLVWLAREKTTIASPRP